MSASSAPVVPVLTAERAGGSQPSEDRIFTTDNAVIVLDGASHPDPTVQDGGWLADHIGHTVRNLLAAEPQLDLAIVLEHSIRQVASAHQLSPGASPSTTVAIARWTAAVIDVLVLCDSPVVIADRSGKIHELRDNRLADATVGLPRPAGFTADDLTTWRALVAGQERRRNTPTGYWVAEAVPEAAHHAITASWPTEDVSVVLAMTDGVADGVDQYGLFENWADAVDLATDHPQRLVDAIHEAEAADPTGTRWRRYKRHDDKALAVLRFDLAATATE